MEWQVPRDTQVEASRRWLTIQIWGSRSRLDRRESSIFEGVTETEGRETGGGRNGEAWGHSPGDEGQWHVETGAPVLGLGGGCPGHHSEGGRAGAKLSGCKSRAP